MLEQGLGGPTDLTISRTLFERAAGQGLAEASYAAGRRCYVDEEYQAAKHHWEAAAAQQHAGATGALAVLYLHGLGVPRDLARGAHQLAAAAILGDRWSVARLELLDRGIRQVPASQI